MLDGERLKFKLRLLLARLNHLKFSSPSTYIFLTSFPIIHQQDLRNMYAWTLPQGCTSYYFLSRWEISSVASRKKEPVLLQGKLYVQSFLIKKVGCFKISKWQVEWIEHWNNIIKHLTPFKLVCCTEAAERKSGCSLTAARQGFTRIFQLGCPGAVLGLRRVW